MTQTTPDTISAKATENQLWTDYMVALARKQECWRLRAEAWHAFALTGYLGETAGRVAHQCSDMHDDWVEKEQEAYKAWKQVAYPLYDIPLPDDETSEV